MKTAVLRLPTCNAKLAPVTWVDVGGRRKRPVPAGPYAASTHVSISATCPSACPLRDNGCFAQTGFLRFAVDKLDRAARGKSSFEVIAEECRLIDEAKGIEGVDLRLHVAGDVRTAADAYLLGLSAVRWRRRGGGTVWTFTHAWRDIPREAWGSSISVLASCETPAEAEQARAAGYAPSIVITPATWPADGRAFGYGGVKVVPCPAETRGRTCIECRLCLDAPLMRMGVAIGFVTHGNGSAKAQRAVWRKLLRNR